MYRSILVPLDGSPFAEHTLPHALSIARATGARIRLVTVVQPLPEAFVDGMYYDTSSLQREEVARSESYIAGVATRLRGLGAKGVEAGILHGDAATSLCELLANESEDLVVLASHGRSALGRFWLGSVADEMIRHSPCPLLLVRPGEAEQVDLGRVVLPRRVVIPLDGTPFGEQILEPTLAFLEGSAGVEVVLVRVLRSVASSAPMPDVPEARKEARHLLEQIHSFQTALRQEALMYLDIVARRLASHGLHVRSEVVVDDRPAEAILREADSRHADLVAICTHGRRGLMRLVLGGTADKVIRGSATPILVFRPV
jgi:nucleotide-binding universal stress UspA family protein